MAKKNAKVQVNEFDETLAASKSFYEKNKNAILYGGGGLLAVIIIALLVHQFYITPRNLRAQESIFYAEQAFMDGNYEKALNGDGANMGFLSVIDEYGSTKAGNIACLYAAKCYAATEKYQEAIDMLDKFDGCGDILISPAAIALKGNCYAALGQNDKAADLLVKAAKQADNNTISPTCLLQAGQIYASLGQNDKALDCYKQIKSKYQQSNVYYEIDKYIEAAQQ
ncbi:MAG: tetratricopeptide repeat protein [Bacteroidaceae bacterium]|nr:tetratricopeptide repeat protein [Bacteroidaceae bacterium]